LPSALLCSFRCFKKRRRRLQDGSYPCCRISSGWFCLLKIKNDEPEIEFCQEFPNQDSFPLCDLAGEDDFFPAYERYEGDLPVVNEMPPLGVSEAGLGVLCRRGRFFVSQQHGDDIRIRRDYCFFAKCLCCLFVCSSLGLIFWSSIFYS